MHLSNNFFHHREIYIYSIVYIKVKKISNNFNLGVFHVNLRLKFCSHYKIVDFATVPNTHMNFLTTAESIKANTFHSSKIMCILPLQDWHDLV